ncbi:MAG: hypothetical protein JNK53_05805 [Phycisphaerae bacterium]|nr:hypothetical protein [Phycisphaerae bacterium]
MLTDAGLRTETSVLVPAVVENEQLLVVSRPHAEHLVAEDLGRTGSPLERRHAGPLDAGLAVHLHQLHAKARARLGAIGLEIEQDVVGPPPRADLGGAGEAVLRQPHAVRAVSFEAQQFGAVGPPAFHAFGLGGVEFERDVRGLSRVLRRARAD